MDKSVVNHFWSKAPSKRDLTLHYYWNAIHVAKQLSKGYQSWYTPGTTRFYKSASSHFENSTYLAL